MFEDLLRHDSVGEKYGGELQVQCGDDKNMQKKAIHSFSQACASCTTPRHKARVGWPHAARPLTVRPQIPFLGGAGMWIREAQA